MNISKTKHNNISFIDGTIWNKLIIFALPIAATNILQQLFNTADMAVVGRFASSQALAAVGSTTVIINFMIELFAGLSIGINVIISRFIGSGNLKRANDCVHTSILLALILGLFLGFLGITVTKPALSLMSVPNDILDLATLYLRIYLSGMPFIVLYNFCAAILRSRGNTKLPFYALLFSGIINVILNLFFVKGLGMSVDGVAIATVISNITSAGILVYYLIYKDPVLKLNIKKLKIDIDILFSFLKIGIPTTILGTVFSVSNIIIQSSINSLGTDVVSASTAASSIEIYIQFFGNAFAQAVTTFISQNYGAGNYNRCRKVARIALFECLIFTIFLSAIVFIFGRTILKIFTTDTYIIEIAMTRMKYTVIFKFIQCIMDIMVGCLQGYGYTLVPALISIFGVCFIRLMWIVFVFPHFRTLESIMMIYPITQGIASISHTFCYFVFQKRHLKK